MQNKNGCVYVVKFKNFIKIGATTNIKKRLEHLRFMTKEKEIEFYSSLNTSYYYKCESIILKLLEKYKIQGEYFNYSYEKAKKIIQKVVKNQEFINLKYAFDRNLVFKIKDVPRIFKKEEIIEYFGKVWFKYNKYKKMHKTLLNNRYLLYKLSENEKEILEKRLESEIDYTINEVMIKLKKRKYIILNWIDTGILKAYKLPILKGGWRVKPEEIERLRKYE